jgi:hypothetical protein
MAPTCREFRPIGPDWCGTAFALDCHTLSSDKVRITLRNVSLPTVDLPAAALHVQVFKRRVG